MRSPILAAAAFGLAACGAGAQTPQQAPITKPAPKADLPFAVTPVATFKAPWALAFLPDGRMLVTEKKGMLKLVSADGKTQIDVAGVPAVDSGGQGGLMDVAISPQFAKDGLVYFSYSAAGDGGLKGVILARGKLAATGDAARLEGVTTLYTASPFVEGGGHYSGRILFAPDGTIYYTNGERQKFDPAQDPSGSLGKVLHLTAEGKPAGKGPLTARGFKPEVVSYGHRNLLGLAFDDRGRLWEVEMGPLGGDELNLVVPGRNYGWPIVSNGNHYDGKDIPDHPTRQEFEAPKASWNPSIAPSSLMIYSGRLFPAWRNSAFIGALAGKGLVRVALNGTEADEIEMWDMKARIRGVRQGPDGAIWVLEDAPGGRLLRLTPKG
ncbi:MAG: PQQ-dependent sugar dehydrogenase [Sphingomonas fennica]